MMKTRKLLTLCLILALVLSILPASVLAVGQFADVKGTDYFYVPVLWAAEQGITTGVSATSFAPEEECTRAQIVTFLWRYNGMPEPKTAKSPFTDVKKSDYFYKAVLWAVEQGITTGTSKTAFSPEDTCTRAQAATFLYRSHGNFENIELSSPFVDIKKGEYYYNPVLWAVKNEITNGTSNTTFSPEDNCTRAQIVTFLYRYECNLAHGYTLKLEKTNLELELGDTYTMTYKYTGTKTLTWSSSNTAVCTVSNGIITAKSAGTANITLTDGDKSAQCKVTVKAKEINVTLDITESNKTVYVGDSFMLTYKYTGNKTLTWSSSDSSVATVDNNGNVTAKKAGTTTIKVTDGSKSDTCAITVKGKESSDVGTLTINTKHDTDVYIGETLQIDFTYTGDKSKLTFKSDDTSILTVNNSGLVTGVSEGVTIVYVYHGNTELGKVRLCSTARPSSGPKAESIWSGEFTGPYFNGTSGVVGNYMNFTAWAKTSGDNQKVNVTSSNTSVATVTSGSSGSGMWRFKVSFVGAGSTTITITSEDGYASTSYILNVKGGYGYSADGLLSPEDFVMYANKVMADNGATIDTNSYMGYRVLTLSSSDLTWYNARACAEAWVREFWPIGRYYMGLSYQGMNEDGKHVFYIHR